MGDHKKNKRQKRQPETTAAAESEANIKAETAATTEVEAETVSAETETGTEAGQNASNQQDQTTANQTETAVSDEELNQVLVEADDRFRRLAAEYENFRRRSQDEKNRLYEQAVVDVVSSFLPVVDNIERALSASEGLDPDNEQAASVRTGVEMIHRQIKEVLEKQGVEEIEALGETFDPNLHAAVLHEDSDDHGHQEVTEVFEKGWRRGDKVLRHSVVKVAN